MRNLLSVTAALAALALTLPASAAEKGTTGHCAMTAQGACIDRDPPLGWNVGTPYACQTTFEGGNVFQYSYWTNGEYWWVENIPSLGAALLEGCDTSGPRSQYVLVINGSTGAFDAVQNRIPGY